MSEQFGPIQALLDRVRARTRRLVVLEATMRGALTVAAILAVALGASMLTGHAPYALVALGVVAVIAALSAVVWAVSPLRQTPTDRMVARFIEERTPALDERLVSAVDVVTARDEGERPALAAAMVRDAARAASSVDAAAIVSDETLRRQQLRAAGACLALLVALVASRHAARRTFDAATLILFPSHVRLDVTPGNTRVQSGADLTVDAQLVGNTAPVVAQLLQAPQDSDDWRPAEMESQGDGRFRLTLSSLSRSFRYKVLAGAATSPVFDVAVVRPPRVARIDVAYAYPSALGLAPRTEEDGGDIYGPEGTAVTVTVHTDAPVAQGQMVLGPDKTLALGVQSPTVLKGQLQISENGSYRVALADADGMKSQGDTEYFIRILDDRPPEVHVLRPASDRRVTRLDEVEIVAEAQDDFGISALDLVYAVRGGAEKTVPLRIPSHSTSVNARHMLYLEDIDVAPGDFVSYYVRARDLARGKKSSESRSDIFFLEVRPFEEEFTLAQTQAAQGGGSGGNPQLDDLVNAQKEIIVATWKLDRRSRDAGAKSEQDIRTIGKSEAELKTRVEQTSSGFRENTMRDPRRTARPAPRPGGGPQPPQPAPVPGTPGVGQSMPEEDAMTTASNAMGKAVTSLNALNTTDAMPHEMEALNALLKAQADVKKRQIQRQQAASGSGQNRSTEDLSSLFDKELARNQQTNYETKTSAEQEDDKNASTIDRVRDLARRQDELVRKQQELARNQSQMSAEEVKRQLDSLTREQNDLRDRAEQVAKQLQQQGAQPQGQQGGQQGQSGQEGQKSQSGQPSGQPGQQAGQQGQAGQSGERRPGNSQNARAGSQGAEGQQGQPGQQPGQQGQEMRDISDEMRSAANDLRRQDAGQASARGAKALDRLRELEQQLQGGTAEGRRRALGDLQLEARQLADQQRQLATESARQREGQAGSDTMRRLAGEQDRLAERLERVQEGLRQQSAPAGAPGRSGAGGTSGTDASKMQQAASDAAKDIQNQRLTERMQQAAEAMRRSAANPSSASSSGPASGTPTARQGAPNQAGAQQELARALDRLADRLNLVDAPQDDESRKMNDQVARARDLRSRMDDLTRQLQELDQQASNQSRGVPQPSAQGQAPSSTPSAQPGSGQGGSSGDPAAMERLRADIDRQMKEVRQLLAESQKDNSKSEGGPGATFEGQGMVLSAPGTQGFKQDFAKWQELTRQVTLALDNVESSLAKRLREKSAKDRLASGGDERAPAEYAEQVDAYFKALAARKRP